MRSAQRQPSPRGATLLYNNVVMLSPERHAVDVTAEPSSRIFCFPNAHALVLSAPPAAVKIALTVAQPVVRISYQLDKARSPAVVVEALEIPGKPIRFTLPIGCARTGSGQAAAAPPRRPMNSRRLIDATEAVDSHRIG